MPNFQVFRWRGGGLGRAGGVEEGGKGGVLGREACLKTKVQSDSQPDVRAAEVGSVCGAGGS